MQKRVAVCVLGRGIQRKSSDGPLRPTRIYDYWDITTPGALRPEVLPKRVVGGPNWVIGGGEWNLGAAIELYPDLKPAVTVFAYGNRSPYLTERGYPSESQIMTDLFADAVSARFEETPYTDIFNEAAWNTAGSGTFQEVRNMLVMGQREECDEIVFLTVSVHMTRVAFFIAQHLREDGLAHLAPRIRLETSESVLLRYRPEYASEIFEMFRSPEYSENLRREQNAIANFLAKGVTQTSNALATAGK